MSIQDAFAIDLERGPMEVLEYDREDILDDLEQCGGETLADLDDYDFRVFETRVSAERWLSRYRKAFEALRKKQNLTNRKLPAMRYRRRYLVQTLMGEKLETYRDYESRSISKPGMLFNFHDQTYFLTVRLVSVERDGTQFKYTFENV